MSYSFPYVFWAILMLALGLIEYYSKDKHKIQLLECLWFVLFFGLRAYVGTDWTNYIEFYDNPYSDGFLLEGDFEPGFVLLCSIFRFFGADFLLLSCFITIFQAYLIHSYFSTKVKYMFLVYIALIALFPVLVIDVLRNFCSLLLGFKAIDYWTCKKKKNYFFYVILSISFHITGVIFFFLPLMAKKYWSKSVITTIFLVGLCIYFLQIRYLSTLLLTFSSLFIGRLSLLFERYLLDSADSNAYAITIGILEKIFFFIVVLYKYEKIVRKKIVSPLVFNSFCLFVFMYLMCTELAIFIERVAVLLSFAYLIMVIQVPGLYFRTFNKKTLFGILMLLCLLKIYITFNSVLYEYNTVFNYTVLEERKSKVGAFYNDSL